MCGIAGMIDFSGEPADVALLEEACGLLAHRGPDDRGSWYSTGPPPSVGLAHTRLAVLDCTQAGHQPMSDPQGRYWLTYNGEIYNYRELRGELARAGWAFRTDTDTEVLLAGYAQQGSAILERLNGMWAFCLYDTVERRGLLCRDRFGVKPLLYAVGGGRLLFASELGVLRRFSPVAAAIRPASVHEYLRFGWIAHPHTIYEDHYKLPPGHLLEFDARGPQPARRYYSLQPDPDAEGMAYSDACAAVRSRIDAAVRARTIADVPLGAFLSGGLDSSIVVSHLARVTRGRVKTFSIGYPEHPAYDESEHAEAVARHLGTDHQEIQLTFTEVIAALPEILDHINEPFADASLIPVTLLSRATRSAVTVALSGDGADELFGGYHRYFGHYHLARFMRIPEPLRTRLLQPLITRLPISKSGRWSDRLRQVRKLLRGQNADPFERHLAWSRILSPESEALLDPEGVMTPAAPAQAMLERQLPEDLRNRWSGDPLNQILLADLHHQLPVDMLHKVDLASMSCGLEVRVPMLDRRVVELCSGLPSSFKIHGRHGKRLLKDAYRDALPAKVLVRRKMGFELPIGEFLREELRDMFLETVTPQCLAEFPGLDYSGVIHIYQEHCQRRGEHADLLYALLALCWWLGKK